MTSRLKKKLDHMEEQGTNLNESFCLIGTPLPSLADTKRDKNEFVPVWKQEVRDEQGRRRFHGAFTGGFSAGYFNTVGSKEGWTPSTFVSSRGQRASKTQAVEDFMDDEDLADLKDSRRLENTETFRSGDGFGTAAELGGQAGEGSLTSALSSLIQPSTSSIGQKLLMKMGWKPGQGVGPRLTARQLRLQERKIGRRAAHVGVLPSQTQSRVGVDDLDGDEEMDMDMGMGMGMVDARDKDGKKHTFAPRDTKLLLFDNKQDRSGLGYIRGGGMNLSQSQTQTGPSRTAPSESQISSGFGLGGHDADEDDLDIYSSGPSALRDLDNRRTAYDRDEDDDMDHGVVLLGEGMVGADRNKKRQANVPRNEDPRNKARASGSAGYTWHDGRPVIPGFVVDINIISNDKWFPFPDIPEGWRPRPARVWQTNRRWDQAAVKKEEPVIPTGRNRPQMTADERGKALGEEQLREPTKSIFDYMSAKSKERLAQVIPGDRQAGVSMEPEQEVKPEPAAARDGVIVPPLSPRTASAALKGFIPFGDDPAKQERYTSYLRSQVHDSSEPNPKLLPATQLDQINKELSDFAKSAQMFRPLSFAMANRFTSSKLSAQDMVQPKPGLHIPDPNKVDEWKDKTRLEEEIKEVLTPREEAARAGMFGKMTRVTSDWVPHALLCKRFGVANPWPDGPPGSKPKESGAAEASVPSAGRALGTKPLLSAPGQDVAWQNNFVHQTPAESSQTEETAVPGEPPKERQPRNIGEVGLAEDVNQGRDTLTYKKPEMDIFKAIFASDDEGDDSDDEDQDDNDAADRMVIESKPAISAAPAPKPIADREYSPAPPPPSNLPIAGDIARPVFAPSAHRLTSKPESDVPKLSIKKKDKKRDRAKAKTMLSFDMGDDEGDADDQGGREEEVARERDRKRRRKEEKREEKPREKNKVEVKPAVIDEDDEWVEAPPVAR